MDLNDIEPLLAALAANPANALLRMAIVRRLLDIGQKSRALAIVFDLEPAQVVAADDRRLVADLLVESGLLDRAAPYLDGSPAPHSTPAATLSPTQIQPAPPPREAQATAAAANSPSVRHNLRVVAGTFGPQSAELELSVDGETRVGLARGDGPVDAIFNAIKALYPHEVDLQLYQVHAVTEGTDAQAEVTVRLEENGKTVTGRAADTDTLVASAKAYLNALNKLLVKRQKTAPEAMSATH